MCQDAGNVASRWIVSKDKVPYGRWASYRCTHLNLDYWLLIETTSATHSMLRHQSRRTTSTRTSPISPLAALRKHCLQLLPRGPLLLRHLIHHGNGEERGAVHLSKWSCFLVSCYTSLMMRIGKSMQYFFAFWHSEIEDSSDRVRDVLNSPVWVFDRHTSSNLQNTYRTYKVLSLRTGEDPPLNGSTSLHALCSPGCEQGHSTCDVAKQLLSSFWWDTPLSLKQ